MKQKLLLILLLSALKTFSQDGTTDTTFGINGKITNGFGTDSSKAYAIAFQPDGKLLVGGTCISSHGENDFALARYNNAGALDTSFGAEGKVITNFLEVNNNYNYIHSVHVLDNGKIVVFGTTGLEGLIPESAIVRYNSDGTLDTGFGNNGKVISGLFPANTYGTKLALQPDGKYIITSVKLYNADPNYYIGVERYLEDGSPDLSFGTNGQVVTSFGTGRSIPMSVVLQPDGKIVVAGSYQQGNVVMMACARFNQNGALDTGFDSDGKTTTTFGAGTSSEGISLFVNTDGKIVVAGAVYSSEARNFSLVQYNSNGSLDTTFDGDGKALSAFADEMDYSLINNITRQPDGKYLVACKVTDFTLTTSNFVIRRYNSDITADTGFGNNGRLSTMFDSGLNEAHAVAINSDNEIFGAGVAVGNGYSNFGVAKYNNNGSLDITFGEDGKTKAIFEKANDRIKIALVTPDNKIIAVGTSAFRQSNNANISNIALAKYNSDGTADTSFGAEGKVLSNFNNRRNAVVTAALQADGKIVVSNNHWVSTNSYELIRYKADGSLDTFFGDNGYISLDFKATVILCHADGRITVAGDSENGIIISRYNNNGTPDTGFGSDGIVTLSLGEQYWESVSAVLQPDGKVIVSDIVLQDASSPPMFGTARINTNGSLDTAFGNNGKILTIIGDACFPEATFLQPDGKIIVAGKSVAINHYFSSVRYTSDGTIDTEYGTNGISSSQLWSDYQEINSVILQADGKLLAAVSKLNQTPNIYDFKIRRFNTDGTYDVNFGGTDGVGTSFYGGYDEAFSIALQSDNKIIVAGATHNGLNEDFALTRYNNASILGGNGFDENVAGITLYPNPVGNRMYIQLDNKTDSTNYSIFTLAGQLVAEGYAKDHKIDTNMLSRGVYFIRLAVNNTVYTKKFIKE